MGGRGYDETVDILGAFANPDIFKEVVSKHSRAIFLRSRYRIGIFLGGC